MEKKFPSFYNLIDEDPAARKYFNSLPMKIKLHVDSNAKNIHTAGSLKDFAQNYRNPENP